jgi:putative spermidine/putrescine transport system permease protein
VYIYFQIPLGIILLYPLYDSIKQEFKEAAYILKASKLNFWRYIGIPLILPGLMDTFSILFANALGAYATAVALSSGNFNFLSIRIGALISGEITLKPELACALAMILAFTIILMKIIVSSLSRLRRWNVS